MLWPSCGRTPKREAVSRCCLRVETTGTTLVGEVDCATYGDESEPETDEEEEKSDQELVDSDEEAQ